jgi:hypothetical protein
VRFDRKAGPGAAAEAAIAYFDAGVDLVVVGLTPPYDPADVEVLAGALEPLLDS